MKTIHKYEVPMASLPSIALPRDAKVLSFQTQDDTPVIWALVDTDMPKVERQFVMVGTGHPIDGDDLANLTYIGSTQHRTGPRPLVWHLFERR